MRKEIRARKARRTHGGPNVLIIAPQYIAGPFKFNATGELPETRLFGMFTFSREGKANSAAGRRG
jgi:hypothetical protein